MLTGQISPACPHGLSQLHHMGSAVSYLIFLHARRVTITLARCGLGGKNAYKRELGAENAKAVRAEKKGGAERRNRRSSVGAGLSIRFFTSLLILPLVFDLWLVRQLCDLADMNISLSKIGGGAGCHIACADAEDM